MTSLPAMTSTQSAVITTTPTATVESTAIITTEYQSTHRSTVDQTITTATATVVESTATLTTTYYSTYRATLGDTLTLYPPPVSWTLQPLTTMSSALSSEAIATVTEVAITVVEPDHTFISTVMIPVTTQYTTGFPPTQPSPYVVIVGSDDHSHGWDSWSSAQKGGLIASVIIASFLILTALTFCCNSRKKTWLANDWSVNSHPGWGAYQPGQVVTHGNHGWGLRGGGESGSWERLKVGRIARSKRNEQHKVSKFDEGSELEEARRAAHNTSERNHSAEA